MQSLRSYSANQSRPFRSNFTYQRGWTAVGVVVVGFELACPPGQMLSHGADAFLARHPVIGRAVIGAVALHLANVFTDLDIEHLDVVHQIAKALGK